MRGRTRAQPHELSVGRDKIYYLLRTGQLRSIKIGKLRRITKQACRGVPGIFTITAPDLGGFFCVWEDFKNAEVDMSFSEPLRASAQHIDLLQDKRRRLSVRWSLQYKI